MIVISLLCESDIMQCLPVLQETRIHHVKDHLLGMNFT